MWKWLKSLFTKKEAKSTKPELSAELKELSQEHERLLVKRYGEERANELKDKFHVVLDYAVESKITGEVFLKLNMLNHQLRVDNEKIISDMQDRCQVLVEMALNMDGDHPELVRLIKETKAKVDLETSAFNSIARVYDCVCKIEAYRLNRGKVD